MARHDAAREVGRDRSSRFSGSRTLCGLRSGSSPVEAAVPVPTCRPARVVRPPPDGVNLDDIAQRVTYVSSPYHSRATRIRRPRPDASKCPPEVSKDLERVERWLREAVRLGRTGVWVKGFPRYVWHRVGDVIF